MYFYIPVVGGAEVTQVLLSIGMTVLGTRKIWFGNGRGIDERMVADTCILNAFVQQTFINYYHQYSQMPIITHLHNDGIRGKLFYSHIQIHREHTIVNKGRFVVVGLVKDRLVLAIIESDDDPWRVVALVHLYLQSST